MGRSLYEERVLRKAFMKETKINNASPNSKVDNIVNVKFFENERIRTAWDEKKETWYFSIVDVIEILTDSTNPQTYWRVMKKRLKKEGNESVTNCNALKTKRTKISYSRKCQPLN